MSLHKLPETSQATRFMPSKTNASAALLRLVHSQQAGNDLPFK
jgi:hypothetical protein